MKGKEYLLSYLPRQLQIQKPTINLKVNEFLMANGHIKKGTPRKIAKLIKRQRCFGLIPYQYIQS